MLAAFLPLLLLIVIIAGIIFAVKRCAGKNQRGPVEKEGLCKGLLVAWLTDSWLFGLLYAKKNSDYDYDKRRLR